MAGNEYEIPGYSSRMSTQLYKLQQDGYMCDAVIATNSGIINVHKLVLMASCSPLLMESVRKTEKTGGSICMIEIPAEIEDVKRFVQALYTGKIFLDQDCIDKIIGIGQILKMEEETKFLEKIKAEFQNSSEKDFPQEIDVKNRNETGTITLQVDGETIKVQTEDSIKDGTLQNEVGITAESDLSLVELPSYGSENDIEMHIPGFEYKNEESGTGVKRERCDDSSHEEPGDGAMTESKRQRVSDDIAVTNVKQEPDGSPPDTESVNQNEKGIPTNLSTELMPYFQKKTKEHHYLLMNCRIYKDVESESETEIKQHICNLCSYSSKRKFDLKRHMSLRHKEVCNTDANNEIAPKKYLCYQCGVSYTSRHGLRLHVRDKLLQTFRFHCKVCNKGFNRLWDFTGHVTKHKVMRMEKCNECGKSFQYRQGLKEHQKIHYTKGTLCSKSIICSICGEGLSCKNALREHEKGAHEDRKFSCVCGKSYAWRSSCQYHTKICKSMNIRK